MAIVAIAGMPGSGKSRLITQYEGRGFVRFDDINKAWRENLASVRELLVTGRDVVVSDIEFCRKNMRKRLEDELGTAVQWVFFENNPYVCARNVLYRAFVEKRDRPWLEELKKIDRLSKEYSPTGDVHPVALADAAERAKEQP